MFITIKNILIDVKSTLTLFIYTVQMTKFIKRASLPARNKVNDYIILVVQPLYMISWPFYMIALGLVLEKKGKTILFFMDDTYYAKNMFFYKISILAINHCMRLLSKKGFQAVRLSEIEVANTLDNISDDNFVKKLADMQAIWFTRGEMGSDERKKEYAINIQKITYAADYIELMIKQLMPERIIVAGGIIGTSGIYLNFGKKLNVPVSTIDGGEGINLMSNSGPAAQLTDIAIAFKMFPDEEREFAYNAAKVQLKKRMEGKDSFAYQTKKVEDEQYESGSILLLLNSVWDQAALGLHVIYPGMNEWILETVKWVVENTEESIVIRQHPAERNKIVSTKDDYKKLLEPFIENKRVIFVSANNDLNTYGLIYKSKVVIAYSTTTALEATMIGKPVITVSNCYYSDLGFVFKPQNLKEYFQYIKLGISNKLTLSETQTSDAALCYYLSQVQNWIFTDFTATMKDFNKWVKMSPHAILQFSEVQDMVDSFITGVPIALIRHHKIFPQIKKEYQIEKKG